MAYIHLSPRARQELAAAAKLSQLTQSSKEPLNIDLVFFSSPTNRIFSLGQAVFLFPSDQLNL